MKNGYILDKKKRLYSWMNENEEIYQVVRWISCLLLSTYIAKLSTMTQDAMVYKVSSCFFFMVICFVFYCSSILGPITLCKLPFH